VNRVSRRWPRLLEAPTLSPWLIDTAPEKE
jgi:hypothetical protein